jgi:hypothetical protein
MSPSLNDSSLHAVVIQAHEHFSSRFIVLHEQKILVIAHLHYFAPDDVLFWNVLGSS